MKIELREVSVRELTEGYADNAEQGVVAFGGNLDVRPPYQREFIYDDDQREAVIDTVSMGFPLNVMYWAERDDGTFEVIDGQQRTISLCQFVNGDFAHNMRYFHNLREDEREKILSYRLMVYLCSGTDSEKLAWFRTINIAGEELDEQELRNAVYCGSFIGDAKRYFSKRGCPAYQIAKGYIKGEYIRQDFLETAIRWHSDNNIEAYMAAHQHAPNANELWLYFKGVIDWVEITFPKYHKSMLGVDWGRLYKEHHEKTLDSKMLAKRIDELLLDSDVTKDKGIYEYVLDGDERHLSIRAFDDNTKRDIYKKQGGKCAYCGKRFELKDMHADHITPWCKGGRTIPDNCQMLCVECNLKKGSKLV